MKRRYQVTPAGTWVRATLTAERLGEMLGMRAVRGRELVEGCLVEWNGPDEPPLPNGAEAAPVGGCLGPVIIPEEANRTAMRYAITRDEAIALTNVFGAPRGVWYKQHRCLAMLPADFQGIEPREPEPDEVQQLKLFLKEKAGWNGNGAVPDQRLVKVTVGCDPEFELETNEGRFVFPFLVLGKTVLDAPIGTDGSGDQLELRPYPGSPGDVVSSLRRLLNEVSQMFPDFRLNAAGHRAPCGGHIHIGISLLGVQPSLGAGEIDQYVRALDAALGSSVDKSGLSRGSYKQRVAWREQPWGFEYRTPPAAIFGSPDLALAALEIAAAVTTRLAIRGEVELSSPATNSELMELGVPEESVKVWRRFLREPVPDRIPVLENWGIRQGWETVKKASSQNEPRFGAGSAVAPGGINPNSHLEYFALTNFRARLI